MKFPSYGLVYDYSLEDGGVSRKHSKDDDDEDHHTGEVRGRFDILTRDGRGGERKHYELKFQTINFEVVSRFYFVEDCAHICVALRMLNDLKNDFAWLSLRKLIQVCEMGKIIYRIKFFTY